MPRYDFRCEPCDIVVESITYKPDPHHCGAKLKRIYSPPAIRFKGGGFYVNGG